MSSRPLTMDDSNTFLPSTNCPAYILGRRPTRTATKTITEAADIYHDCNNALVLCAKTLKEEGQRKKKERQTPPNVRDSREHYVIDEGTTLFATRNQTRKSPSRRISNKQLLYSWTTPPFGPVRCIRSSSLLCCIYYTCCCISSSSFRTDGRMDGTCAPLFLSRRRPPVGNPRRSTKMCNTSATYFPCNERSGEIVTLRVKYERDKHEESLLGVIEVEDELEQIVADLLRWCRHLRATGIRLKRAPTVQHRPA